MLSVRREQNLARPISADTGLREIESAVLDGTAPPRGGSGGVEQLDLSDAYVEHLLSYVKRDVLKPLKIVVNPGNGGAGAVIDPSHQNNYLPTDR